ncbi:MAG: hypothetical protein LBN95_09825 [Prevotellaceae bacterium]|jgi:hypothetical protein|nr:hypothetical protein [Prevotellaceae bacterium]
MIKVEVKPIEGKVKENGLVDTEKTVRVFGIRIYRKRVFFPLEKEFNTPYMCKF